MKSPLAYLLILLLLPQVNIAQLSLQDSLVAYYPLDGNSLDMSGNGNDGIAQNGAQLCPDRHGIPNSAYEFDGIDDYILLQSNNKFEPQLPVTITAWVFPENTNFRLNTLFTNDNTDDRYYGLNMNISLAANAVGGSFMDGGFPSPGDRRSKYGTTTLSPHKWYHLAVVIRGPLDMSTYVNGKEDCGSYSGTGTLLDYAATPTGGAIGRDDPRTGPNNYNYFWGKIDELRFYNRALEKLEIQKLAELPLSHQTAEICVGDSVSLDAGYGISYSWSPAQDCLAPNARHLRPLQRQAPSTQPLPSILVDAQIQSSGLWTSIVSNCLWNWRNLKDSRGRHMKKGSC